MKYKNLTIIGTSHIAIESVKEVESAILSEKPDLVALELDPPRFMALMSKRKKDVSLSDIKSLGVKGYLFASFGSWVEKKLGEVVGVPPGSEMKKAAQTAYRIRADISLIDQDLRITIRRLIRFITFKEKLRFVLDLLKGIIFRKPVVKFDLTKVPEEKIIKTLLKKVKMDYPNLYRVLVTERNAYMSKALYNLMQDYNNIVAVVGAGHESEIISLIKRYKKRQDIRTVLLKPR